GETTKADYQDVFIPAVDAALKTHDKVALYYETAPDFTGYSPGAMGEDAVLGFRHYFQFSRVAILSDVGWIRGAVAAFRPLFPCPVRLYRPDEAAAARRWIETGQD
ncbi:MAG TPA: STAS/SEC14 domain-containing protein, partial [Asticcacaulis sp.]